MSLFEPRDYIDGDWSTPSVEMEGWLEDPNTGSSLGPMLATSDDDVERALAAAARTHAAGAWARTEPAERAAILMAIADELEKRAPEIAEAEASQTGVVIGQTSMLAFIVHASFRLAAQQATSGWVRSTLDGPSGAPVEVHRLPWGPAVCLVPWNAPAPMAAHKVANALAAGAPVILKPSEFAPAGSTAIAEACEAVGLPPGVFALVHGGPHVGGALVTDARTRAVSFTGGLAAGRAIAAACAHDFKPAQLELGGNNPVVVMPDADASSATRGIVDLMTSLNGQWCRALGRLIVPRARESEILEAALGALARVKVGDPRDPDSQMGPMIHSSHRTKLRGRIADLIAKGGTAHASTPIPDVGNFFAPTLVTGVQPSEAIEEIFGPVGTVHPYDSMDEALALANGTPFGLEGYVFGTDTDAAMSFARGVHAGGVKINGSTVMSLHIMAPRPAWGLSGFAEEGTEETFRFFCGSRVVGIEGNV